MRKNEYTCIEDFTSQYVGEWGPSDGHWLGLDFLYNGVEYRFNTGSMYNPVDTILPDGRTAIFGIYKKIKPDSNEYQRNYELLGEYASMDDVLSSTVIENTPFKDVIMDDNTELLGQD